NPIAPLKHGIIFALGADQMRQWKLLSCQIKLKRVGERNFEWIILAPGAALEQKFSLLGDNQKFGSLSRSARIFDDRIDHADIEMRQDDRQFLGGELFALP